MWLALHFKCVWMSAWSVVRKLQIQSYYYIWTNYVIQFLTDVPCKHRPNHDGWEPAAHPGHGPLPATLHCGAEWVDRP